MSPSSRSTTALGVCPLRNPGLWCVRAAFRSRSANSWSNSARSTLAWMTRRQGSGASTVVLMCRFAPDGFSDMPGSSR